jgi:hypothetical protein
VFVEPGNPAFWHQDANYIASLTPVNQPSALRFRSNPAAPPLASDVSSRTNIFASNETTVVSPDGLSVTNSITFFSSQPGITPRAVPIISHEEAVVLMLAGSGSRALISPFGAFVQTQDGFTKIVSKADVTKLIKKDGKLVPNPEPIHAFKHRHPWSVFGGVFNQAGRPFVGYFQLCLERGLFQ